MLITEDYEVTNGNSAVTIPEYMHMSAENGDIYFFFPEDAWSSLIAFYGNYQLREDLKAYIPSSTKSWGERGVIDPVQKTGDGYVMKLDIAKQINNETRFAICETLDHLSLLLSIFSSDGWSQKRKSEENEKTQLFSLQLSYDATRSMHATPIVFSISPKVTRFFGGARGTKNTKCFRRNEEAPLSNVPSGEAWVNAPRVKCCYSRERNT